MRKPRDTGAVGVRGGTSLECVEGRGLLAGYALAHTGENEMESPGQQAAGAVPSSAKAGAGRGFASKGRPPG